jgi:threonylcarbamoyladenosine tRNA methylthiotransferase MtaB
MMRIFLDTLGCRLNQSEIEAFANQFRAAGHILVGRPGEADLVIVNTCAVTAKAVSDSRQKIRQAERAGAERIVATGCWATLDQVGAAALPGVMAVIANPDKEFLVPDLLALPREKFDYEPVAREPLPGMRLRTRAFIKVQDGCDNHCTFCITRLARGKSRSRSIKDVVADIRAALKGGTQEVVLTGVQMGGWGKDFLPRQHLQDLIRAIFSDTDVKRLRLSSIEPWDLDEIFFSLWQDPRFCPHLHLPLQSGAQATLNRMARKTNPLEFAALVRQARAMIHDLAVTTDIIVGFPGESEDEFLESLDFVREMSFAAGHVFSYSSRPGTPATRYKDQVPPTICKERSAKMRLVLESSAEAYRRQFIGQTMTILWEAMEGIGPDGWHVEGLSGNYLRVNALAPHSLWNQLSRVRLVSLSETGLNGEIIIS